MPANERDSRKLAKARRKAEIARRDWRKLRQEVRDWAYLARTQGGEAAITYWLVRQNYRDAYRSMRNAANELENQEYLAQNKKPRR